LAKKIVIDACVAFDLNHPKVNFLDDSLKFLSEDIVLISTVNFEETDLKIQRILKSYKNVQIIDKDETKFGKFSTDLETLKINLTWKDRYVLFLANEVKADFVVSSDFNVYDKASRLRKLKNFRFMEPMTTVLLLEYIYNQGKIGYGVFFEKSLYLYKYKEIDNMLEHLGKQNFNVTREEQIEIIEDCKKTMKHRFQFYKDPIIAEFRHLLSLGEIPS